MRTKWTLVLKNLAQLKPSCPLVKRGQMGRRHPLADKPHCMNGPARIIPPSQISQLYSSNENANSQCPPSNPKYLCVCVLITIVIQ